MTRRTYSFNGLIGRAIGMGATVTALRGRNDRAKAVAKQMAMIEAAVTAIETRIDGIDVDETITDAMNDQMTSTRAGLRQNKCAPQASLHAVDGAMSGESPEVSESIPDR